jgi:hypothetical protein
MVVHRNPRAVVRALSLYREAYPEGDLVLICDDGCYNFSDTARHFGAHWEGRARRLTVKQHVGFFMQARETLAFLRALAHALHFIGSSHWLYLESDTTVYRRLPPGPRYTLSGITPIAFGWFTGGEPQYSSHYNPFFRVDAWPPSTDPQNPGFLVPYGGQGGSLYHTQFYRAIAQQPDEHLRAEVALFGACSTTSGVDYVMSSLTYRYNGTIGPLLGSVNRLEHYSKQDILRAAVVHPDKSDYTKAPSEVDLRILGPRWRDVLTAPEYAPHDPDYLVQNVTFTSPVCGLPGGVLKDYEPRLGAKGLAQDARERGQKFDLLKLQGPGYYVVQQYETLEE